MAKVFITESLDGLGLMAADAAARQTSASEIGWVAEQRPTWVETGCVDVPVL